MSPKRLSIFDIATMYEGEQDSATAVPGARVKISTNRMYLPNTRVLKILGNVRILPHSRVI